MTQVVGAKLHVKSIFSLPVGAEHHTSIIDEIIDAIKLLQQFLCTGPDGFKRCQIQLLHLDGALGLSHDLVSGILGLVQATTEHMNDSSSGTEILHGLLANASVGSWKNIECVCFPLKIEK